MAVDPRNFLLNTDFPIDKIVFATSGSKTIASGDTSTVESIAHGLPFTPNVLQMWSFDSDFATTQFFDDENLAKRSLGIGTTGATIVATPDSTNIDIQFYNFYGSSKTFYYRITCLPPSSVVNSTSDYEVSSTAGQLDNFVLNTDYNCLKMFKAGSFSGDDTYDHSLGYKPSMLVWSSGVQRTRSFYTYSHGSLSDTDETGTFIDDTTIDYKKGDENGIDYRGYLD